MRKSNPNSKQLAFDNEVGIATISRDIEFLKNRFDAPIEYDAKKRGYFYAEDFEMPLNAISPADLAVLSLAKSLLVQYEGTPVYEEVSRIIDFLADTKGSGNSEFLDRIALPPMPKIKIDEEIWTKITGAMRENRIIEFDYKGRWKTTETHRRVRP